MIARFREEIETLNIALTQKQAELDGANKQESLSRINSV